MLPGEANMTERYEAVAHGCGRIHNFGSVIPYVKDIDMFYSTVKAMLLT